MRRGVAAVVGSQQFGLLLVILLLGVILSVFAGSHTVNGREVNNFLSSGTLIQVITDASFFAIMAVGATMVIISGGIDLSIGSIYALSGTMMALAMRGQVDVGAGGVHREG
ncbi:MAG: ABC transporter permease [Rhodothermales bacterium]|nr:ABC transporter permease [Rhodothermales bacterium]